MRKITSGMLNAFINGKCYMNANTTVYNEKDEKEEWTIVRLYDSIIAEWKRPFNGRASIMLNNRYNSATTRDRLYAIADYYGIDRKEVKAGGGTWVFNAGNAEKVA